MPDMDGEGLLRAHAGRARARARAVHRGLRGALRGADPRVLARRRGRVPPEALPAARPDRKVRALLERPRGGRPSPERTGDYTSPTRPVVAVAHTMSTAAIAAPAGDAARDRLVPAPCRRRRPAASPRRAPVRTPAAARRAARRRRRSARRCASSRRRASARRRGGHRRAPDVRRVELGPPSRRSASAASRASRPAAARSSS